MSIMNKIWEKRDKFPLYLFYLGLTIELLLVIFDRTALPRLPDGQIFRLTFALCAIKICFTRYTRREWLWLIAVSLFTAVMYFASGQNLALRAVFFIAAMRDVPILPMMKYAFWLTFTGFMTIVSLSLVGVGRAISTTDAFRGEVVETRYHFGLGHPNTFHCMVLMVLFLIIYCYQERLKLSAYAGLFAVNFGLFIFSYSRTAFIICALTIAGAAAFYLWPKLRTAAWPYYAGMALFALTVAFSVWAAANARNPGEWDPWMFPIDRLLTLRIWALHWGGAIEDWTLFATNTDYGILFDMGWVRMFYWFGIVPGAVFTVFHLLLINECRRRKDYMALVIITAAALYTVSEPQFISIYLGRNYLLFLFAMYWGRMLMADGKEEIYWWSALKK